MSTANAAVFDKVFSAYRAQDAADNIEDGRESSRMLTSWALTSLWCGGVYLGIEVGSLFLIATFGLFVLGSFNVRANVRAARAAIKDRVDSRSKEVALVRRAIELLDPDSALSKEMSADFAAITLDRAITALNALDLRAELMLEARRMFKDRLIEVRAASGLTQKEIEVTNKIVKLNQF